MEKPSKQEVFEFINKLKIKKTEDLNNKYLVNECSICGCYKSLKEMETRKMIPTNRCRECANRISRESRCKRSDLAKLLDKRGRSRIVWAKKRLKITSQINFINALGIDIKGYEEYIKSKFLYGMSYETRHRWDIDHIVPLAEANNEEELIALLHYTNTQPMWKKHNMEKNCNSDYRIKINEDHLYMEFCICYPVSVNELYKRILT